MVRQRAGVENEVGVARQAVLEAEGFEGEGQSARRALLDALWMMCVGRARPSSTYL